MEEEKAAAYYDELIRKGEGAARFKQGLGFSSSSSSPSKPSSLFTNFIRASTPENAGEPQNPRDPHLLRNIKSKLKRNHHSRSPDRSHRDMQRERDEKRRKGRSHSSSWEEEEREGRYRRGDRESSYRGRRRRSRSPSPSSRVSHSRDRDRRSHKREKGGSPPHKGSDNRSAGTVYYSKVIEGYSQMTPAERVKAKMKLQLSQTAAKDTIMGVSTGWERFDFNKDAPLDDEEEEIEVADDDISLVKDIERSFRFSAVEARRAEEVKAAHEQAMFGGGSASVSSVLPPPESRSSGEENNTKDGNNENHLSSGDLLSDKVLSMKQGSWRDRALRFQNGSEKN